MPDHLTLMNLFCPGPGNFCLCPGNSKEIAPLSVVLAQLSGRWDPFYSFKRYFQKWSLHFSKTY